MAKDEIDPEELEEEIEIDGEELDILDDLEDEPLLGEDDEDIVDDEAEDDDESMGATIVRKAGDDDDDEDDMVAPDDVEEDLAEILKDRLASEELPAEEDEANEVDDRSSGEDTLQPKRADETLCSSCFMLVKKNATICPMGDDECPVVVKATKKKK